MISLENIAEAVKELERVAKLGLKGGMIWGAPPADRPYYSDIYHPFWAAGAGFGNADLAACGDESRCK